tara:strand:- start:147 stop:344 length:198 start_codon:yes stop_codon:yes gene_type:complete
MKPNTNSVAHSPNPTKNDSILSHRVETSFSETLQALNKTTPFQQPETHKRGQQVDAIGARRGTNR